MRVAAGSRIGPGLRRVHRGDADQIAQVRDAPVEIEVRSTVHGPLISDVLGIDRVLAAPVPAGGRGVPEVALAWTALEPGLTADALFMINRAQDWKQFREAASRFAVPSQNLVYADVDESLWGAAESSVRAQLAHLATR